MVNIPHWPQIPIWQPERKLDLELSFKLLEALDNPQNRLPPTIHIAGTNGKGSTLAMLKSIFAEAGYKIHSYTSPHLLEFNERINVAGESITDSHLFSLLERVKAAADKLNLQPNFFEGVTIAAFLAFAEIKADILLLETGLGGRLDCTNVISNPLLTIITPISYDHTEYLGEDIMQIAYEKAGIIKKGVPCVIGPQIDNIYNLLFNKCDEMSSPSFCYEYDFYAQKDTEGFQYLSKKFNLKLPTSSLRGDHQIQNASSVVAAIMLLNDKFKITSKQITNGLLNVQWPGRLQLADKEITKKLAGDNIKIYLDGAHNNAGSAALANWIKSSLNGNVYLILGMTRNRDVAAFCNLLEDSIKTGVAVPVLSEPSSYSSSVLVAKAKKSKINLTESDSLLEAIKYISKLNNKKSATIIITGSLFLISDFLKL